MNPHIKRPALVATTFFKKNPEIVSNGYFNCSLIYKQCIVCVVLKNDFIKS